MKLTQRLDRIAKEIVDIRALQIEKQDSLQWITFPEEEDAIMARLKQKYGPDFDGSVVLFVSWMSTPPQDLLDKYKQ